MRTFYVRPERHGGYGSGDGTSYENAWNGFKSIDWDAMARGDPATLWVCGSGGGPGGFMTVFVEWSYLQNNAENPFEPAAPRPHPRRESPQPV